MDEIFLTPPSAGLLLGVSDNTVRRWIYAGDLKASRTPGGHYLIARAELERFVASMEIAS